MNIEERHFGLFVYLGIELRNFVFSGLSTKLSEFSRVSIITHQKANALDRVILERNLNLIRIPSKKLWDKKRGKLESYFLSSRRARLRLNGNEIFNLWHDTIPKRIKDYFIGNKLIYTMLRHLARFESKRRYYDQQLSEIIRNNKLTDIVLQSYFSMENMTVAITAKKLGCRIWVINWSWKDYYINEYIPFQPDAFFTWSENLKRAYELSNRQINPEKIKAIGNISYDSMLDYLPVNAKSYYASKYSFNPDSTVILFTMVHPRIYPDEHIIAQKIAERIIALNLNMVILMKPNPMDANLERFKNVEFEGKLITLDNLWHYDEESDFNMITEEGQIEWLDLIYYSQINISVASTVTIEYLVMHKPIVNILFDSEEKIQSEFARLFESPFYRIVNNRKDIIGCRSVADVIDTLQRIPDINCSDKNLDEVIISRGNSLNSFLNVVKE
jgi:hypothetical protein